jgi:hypothetical protein
LKEILSGHINLNYGIDLLTKVKFTSRTDFVKCIEDVLKEIHAVEFDSGARQLAMSSWENFCKLLAGIYVKACDEQIKL